jgi:sugar phosphate permease
MYEKSLRKWQVRMLILSWIAYSCIYLGRVNLSVTIPYIEKTFELTKGQVGLIGSLFYWVYGIGQLTNGYIGDRLSSRIFVFTGLIVTALANIFFGFSSSYVWMLILWAINGYFQSMLWGPIAKTLSHWYPQSKMGGVVIGVSTSMIAGYILTWGLSGDIISRINWRWMFIIPGGAILIFSFIWLFRACDHPEKVGLKSPNIDINSSSNEKNNENSGNKDLEQKPTMSLMAVINKTKLWYVVIACFAQGIIKEGVGLWAPTFMMETQNTDIVSIGRIITLIPLMNLAGMLFAGWLNKQYKYQEKQTIITLFAFGIATLIGLLTLGKLGVVWTLIFLGLSSAAMYGANTLLLGLIPIKYAKYNRVSSVAGFLDFCSYVASGIAASLTGVIVNNFGWTGVMILWSLVAVAGIISLIVSWQADKKLLVVENE